MADKNLLGPSNGKTVPPLPSKNVTLGPSNVWPFSGGSGKFLPSIRRVDRTLK